MPPFLLPSYFKTSFFCPLISNMVAWANDIDLRRTHIIHSVLQKPTNSNSFYPPSVSSSMRRWYNSKVLLRTNIILFSSLFLNWNVLAREMLFRVFNKHKTKQKNSPNNCRQRATKPNVKAYAHASFLQIKKKWSAEYSKFVKRHTSIHATDAIIIHMRLRGKRGVKEMKTKKEKKNNSWTAMFWANEEKHYVPSSFIVQFNYRLDSVQNR